MRDGTAPRTKSSWAIATWKAVGEGWEQELGEGSCLELSHPQGPSWQPHRGVRRTNALILPFFLPTILAKPNQRPEGKEACECSPHRSALQDTE